MRLLTYAAVLVLSVGGRCQGNQRRDVKCNNRNCGVNEICVTNASGERCECMFGYIKTNGNIFCQPSYTERPLDKIIRVNRLKGVLHELFEGDIKLNPDQKRAIDVYLDLVKWNILGKRNEPSFITGVDTNLTDSLPDIPIQYWRLPVPVAFAPDVPDSVRGDFLTMDIKGYAFFRPYNDGDIDYIMVRKGHGCWSYVGRQGGMQEVAVDDGCGDRDTIGHLFFHALGMWHEQNRADRDEYITLHPLNMEAGTSHSVSCECFILKLRDYIMSTHVLKY
ncbi:meprin A subunit beta-like [Haliotis rubra]|uniref:meprin A subunit beta-like n=1 Tax=Haliotis rubra TaxID=36100 RepID=UPI001EE506EC|nr:meprin A subunit beta-like [Haliotis rubra]